MVNIFENVLISNFIKLINTFIILIRTFTIINLTFKLLYYFLKCKGCQISNFKYELLYGQLDCQIS